jgi:hypothetical protein
MVMPVTRRLGAAWLALSMMLAGQSHAQGLLNAAGQLISSPPAPPPTSPVTASPAGSLLAHVGSSPYFTTPDGAAHFLIADHTWNDNQTFSALGTFSFPAYLTYLQAQGANLILYWLWAGTTIVSPANGSVSPWPFNFSAGKWDVSSFNQTYFDKVAAAADAAKAAGIYLSVMLFFDYDPNSTYGWATSVWNGANNINGTTTTNLLIEQASGATLALQEAYVAKMLDTLGQKTNVLYEIANESHNDTTTASWESAIIDFIHAYQASHSLLAQPVGMSALIPNGSDAALTATNADWFAPSESAYISSPPAATGAKVALIDTDHVFGIGGDGIWAWRQFTRGQGGVMIMDDMHGSGLSNIFDLNTPAYTTAETAERLTNREIATVAATLNLAPMRAAGALSSTGFVLADAATNQYVVLAPSGGTFTVNLSGSTGATLNVSWVATATGAITSAGTVSGGSSAQSFTAPTSPAVLVLHP